MPSLDAVADIKLASDVVPISNDDQAKVVKGEQVEGGQCQEGQLEGEGHQESDKTVPADSSIANASISSDDGGETKNGGDVRDEEVSIPGAVGSTDQAEGLVGGNEVCPSVEDAARQACGQVASVSCESRLTAMEGEIDPDCSVCRQRKPDPTPHQLVMYLHALSYKVFYFNHRLSRILQSYVCAGTWLGVQDRASCMGCR